MRRRLRHGRRHSQRERLFPKGMQCPKTFMQRRYYQSILKSLRCLRSGIRGRIHFRKMAIPLMAIAPTKTLLHCYGLKPLGG
jgi:hypothetical protein